MLGLAVPQHAGSGAGPRARSAHHRRESALLTHCATSQRPAAAASHPPSLGSRAAAWQGAVQHQQRLGSGQQRRGRQRRPEAAAEVASGRGRRALAPGRDYHAPAAQCLLQEAAAGQGQRRQLARQQYVSARPLVAAQGPRPPPSCSWEPPPIVLAARGPRCGPWPVAAPVHPTAGARRRTNSTALAAPLPCCRNTADTATTDTGGDGATSGTVDASCPFLGHRRAPEGACSTWCLPAWPAAAAVLPG